MTATTEELIDQLVDTIEYHEDLEGTLEVRVEGGWIALSSLVEDLSDALEESNELALNQATAIWEGLEHHLNLEGELEIRTRQGWDDVREPVAAIITSLES